MISLVIGGLRRRYRRAVGDINKTSSRAHVRGCLIDCWTPPRNMFQLAKAVECSNIILFSIPEMSLHMEGMKLTAITMENTLKFQWLTTIKIYFLLRKGALGPCTMQSFWDQNPSIWDCGTVTSVDPWDSLTQHVFKVGEGQVGDIYD